MNKTKQTNRLNAILCEKGDRMCPSPVVDSAYTSNFLSFFPFGTKTGTQTGKGLHLHQPNTRAYPFAFMQLSISSKTIPPGHDSKGAKTLPPGQPLCTKTLPSGQNMESKAPPPGHKVKNFTNVSINSDTI